MGISGIHKFLKKEESLTVTTKPVTDITYHSAVSGVEWFGEETRFEECGIYCSTKSNPTFEDLITSIDTPTIESASRLILCGLNPNTTYHIKAYVSEFTGSAIVTYYGSELEFTTLPFDKTIHFNQGLSYDSISDIEGTSYGINSICYQFLS